MPNLKSAEKAVRQNAKRRQRNRLHRGRAHTAMKKARIALRGGNVETAREAVRKAAGLLDRAASRGSLHRRNAARCKSRLMKQMAALEARAGSK